MAILASADGCANGGAIYLALTGDFSEDTESEGFLAACLVVDKRGARCAISLISSVGISANTPFLLRDSVNCEACGCEAIDAQDALVLAGEVLDSNLSCCSWLSATSNFGLTDLCVSPAQTRVRISSFQNIDYEMAKYLIVA